MDTELRLPKCSHHSGDYAVLEACPIHSPEAQITGSNYHLKAYGMGEELKLDDFLHFFRVQGLFLNMKQ